MGKRIWHFWPLVLAILLAIQAPLYAQFAPPTSAPAWGPWSNVGRRPAQPHPAVARIVVPGKDNTVSFGSGTLVDARGEHGLVITNWHVVSDAGGVITVIFPDGFRCAARVLKTDQDWDLAALAVWRPKVQPVPLAAAPPQLGEPLTIAGYGSGDYRAATGRCTGFAAPNGQLPNDLVDVSTAARQGDSGGPMFNSKGELAGVLFGTSNGTTVGSYSPRVQWFLASLAPDLGRPDTSNIASRPRTDKPAPSASPPATAPPATVAAAPPVKSPPVSKPPATAPAADQFAVSTPTTDAFAKSNSAEALAPVTPLENDDTAPRVAAQGIGVPPGIKPLDEPPPSDTRSPSLEARVDLSRAAPGISWQAVAGNSIAEQVKTVLAGFGVCAILYFGLRLSGRATAAAKASEAEPA